MTDIKLTLSGDEALVLAEFFAHYEETNRLVFKHSAEHLALQKVSAQIEKSVPELFDPKHKQLLEEARKRIAAGFEGEVSGIEE